MTNDMLKTLCPVCVDENVVSTTLSSEYKILKCMNCNYLYVSDEIDTRAMYSEYGDYLINTEREKFYRKALMEYKYRRFVKEVDSRVAIDSWLDVGCGSADFVSFLNGKIQKVAGVEPSNKLRKVIAKKNIQNIYKDISEIEDNSFDCISEMDVIEHIHSNSLDNHIIELKRKLNSNGVICGSTPNIKSVNFLLRGPTDPMFAPPFHLSYFSRESIEKQFTKHGFKMLFIYTRGINPFFNMQRSNKLQRLMYLSEKILYRMIPLQSEFIRGYGYHIYYGFQKID